ncbi:MAG: hypothetical protein KDB14_10695, partial [Planctomycetales bacterium]|nr:hypothetical protein [Planctomycetales bacterium]
GRFWRPVQRGNEAVFLAVSDASGAGRRSSTEHYAISIPHTCRRLRGQLGKQDVIVLDKLGSVPASKAGAEPLFDVFGTA